MANEYLSRVPTSTGNQRVFTISVWIKRGASGNHGIFGAGDGSSAANSDHFWLSSDVLGFSAQDGTNYINASPLFRDISSWTHYHYIHKTDDAIAADRGQLFVNGVRLRDATSSTFSINQVISWMNKAGAGHAVGARNRGGYSTFMNGEMSDFFFIDGQALTPDVFGFYKQGKGYISVGSAQATDFRPGQWVPKTPRVIKTEINRRGGFGVNGFYLPMNDSSNFGADFHGEPNSIITLKGEDLPQPRNGAPTTTDAYVSQLREDPYKDNLVLALPFVSSGLCTNGTNVGVNTGFGDYSHIIRGSGSAISLTNAGVSIASTAGYYGSAAFFNNASATGTIKLTGTDNAVNFGSGDWTVESWIFPTQLYNYLSVIGTRPDNGSFADAWHIFIDGNGSTGVYSNAFDVQTANGAIKANQWTHIAAVRNKSNLSFYINGVSAGINTNYTKTPTRTSFGIGQFPSQNTEAFSGYLQDLRIYKGVAKYKGGFDVPRPYTPVGIATWRAVPDTTANNFATLNPLRTGGYATLDNGNLRSTGNTATNSSPALSTFNVKSGKWYWELRADTVYNSGGPPRWPSPGVTVLQSNWNPLDAEVHISAYGVGVRGTSTGTASVIGISGKTTTSSVTSTNLTAGDVYMCAMDADNGAIYFGLNGTWYNSGVPTSGSSRTGSLFNYTPSTDNYELSPTTINYNGSVGSANFGQNPTFSGNTTAGTFTDSNGKGLFKYQPPSDFLALCEDNLPTPAISDPGKYFKTVLYTGDGASGRSIVGVGFTPDLVWIKSRTTANSHRIFDSIRGPLTTLISNATNADGVESDSLTSFNTDGFSLGADSVGGGVNVSGRNMVAWCWRAGAGTTSTNTNGSITSVVSVNQDAGFSIVSWTGNGSSTATVGHGLGKTPAFLISKARSGTNDWWVVHKSGNGNLQLNATSALITSGGANGAMGFPSTLTNTTFTFTAGSSSVSNVNASGTTYVTYCWAEIEGFSKFGSYVGNGNADGPFIWTGFTPAFVLFKNASSAYNWYIVDNVRSSVNPVSATQAPNLTTIEDTGWATGVMDFTSNGFKLRGTNLAINESGSTFIFAAFAQSPFAYSNSK
jgi:hypothetical protein